MTPTASPDQIVRDILDANRYMVLATADQSGRPWSTPVYFAEQDTQDFYWVSSPHSTHSHNIAVRPQVAIVVFDSSVPIGTGQGVYMSALAAPVPSTEIEAGIEIFSRRSLRHGGRAWTVEDVQDTTGLRLYRATAEDHWILAKDEQPDHRIPAHLPPGQPRDRPHIIAPAERYQTAIWLLCNRRSARSSHASRVTVKSSNWALTYEPSIGSTWPLW